MGRWDESFAMSRHMSPSSLVIQELEEKGGLPNWKRKNDSFATWNSLKQYLLFSALPFICQFHFLVHLKGFPKYSLCIVYYL